VSYNLLRNFIFQGIEDGDMPPGNQVGLFTVGESKMQQGLAESLELLTTRVFVYQANKWVRFIRNNGFSLTMKAILP